MAAGSSQTPETLAQLLAESERRRAEAEALAEIVRVGAAETNPERVVRFVAEQACHLLGADFAAMALTDRGGTTSWYGLWGNRSNTWGTGLSRQSRRGPAVEALETGRTVVAQHVGSRSGFTRRAETVLKAEGARTLLAAPLFSGEEKPGVLLVGWRTDEKPTSAQIRLSEVLAGYAATVIANARAHAAEQELTRQAEARAVALREAERALSTLIGNLPGVAYRCKNDPQFTVEFVSDACLALTGYEPADFGERGRVSFGELIHPDDRQRVWDDIQAAVQERHPFQLLYRLITADGTEKHVWDRGVGVWSDDGQLLALEGFAQDVTESHRALEGLRVSEERFRRLAENAKDVIWRWELRGSMGLSYISPAVVDLIGYPPDELIGDPDVFSRIVHPEDVPLAMSILQGEHASETINIRGTHRDGRTVWIEHRHTNVYDEEERLVAVEGVARDVTERKQMEERLLRAHRLEAAGQIAGQVAHDFNNLLVPLVGYPDLIKRRLPEDHPAIRLCDEMVEKAMQMAAINEDLLTLGRRGNFDHTPLHFNDIVRQALDQIPASPEGLTIDVDLSEDLLPVPGSAAQLLRVLVNLLANAREAMAEAGTLRVATANIYLESPVGPYASVGQGEYVRLDVQDTGPGIDPAIRHRIFDAFFTTKVASRRHGSGLGLSVVQAIVEDHNGVLDLQTEIGKGTTFSLYFPVVRESVIEPTAENVEGGTESVLIVDDDAGQREVAQRILRALGYSVDVVGSGEAAVERMRINPSDLIIVDMVMKGIDGAETLRRILKARPGQRAILFSGFAESARVRAALAAGAALFLRKPVTLARLAHAVRQVLDAAPSR